MISRITISNSMTTILTVFSLQPKTRMAYKIQNCFNSITQLIKCYHSRWCNVGTRYSWGRLIGITWRIWRERTEIILRLNWRYLWCWSWRISDCILGWHTWWYCREEAWESSGRLNTCEGWRYIRGFMKKEITWNTRWFSTKIFWLFTANCFCVIISTIMTSVFTVFILRHCNIIVAQWIH